jgi:hypothetical protein
MRVCWLSRAELSQPSALVPVGLAGRVLVTAADAEAVPGLRLARRFPACGWRRLKI